MSLSDRRGLEIETGSMDWKIGDNSVVFWRSAATVWWFGAAAMVDSLSFSHSDPLSLTSILSLRLDVGFGFSLNFCCGY